MGCLNSTPQQSKSKELPPSPNRSRLSTKFIPADIKVISQQEKRNGYKPAYACPICFIYYSKILACSECRNFVCFQCFKEYENKRKDDLKCPFCASTTSLFIDHELQAHTYFDTTNNGFLNQQQRKKIDAQLGQREPSRLFPIQESQPSQQQN